MKRITQALRRPLYAVAALGMMLGLVASAVVPGQASAYGEVTDRAIRMSSAVISDTGVNYQLTMTLTSAAASVAIDFCGGSPLYADTCSAVAGLDVSGATVASMTGGATNDWAEIPGDMTATHIEAGGTSEAGASTLVVTFDTIDNPSSLGSFYARVYTYAGADPNWTAVGTPGTVVDFGGIALSTNRQINITARVQEKLTFCVSGLAPGPNCGASGQAVTQPDLTLGHGSPAILDETAIDTANAFVQLSTNAQSGAIVRMKNSNTGCTTPGGLTRDGDTTCDIGPVDGGSATGSALANGDAEFGVYCQGLTGLTAAAPYNDSGTPTYGMDTASGENVTTTYGDQILSSAAAVNQAVGTLTFGAGASLTTPAGVYTATIDLIATGTF